MGPFLGNQGGSLSRQPVFDANPVTPRDVQVVLVEEATAITQAQRRKVTSGKAEVSSGDPYRTARSEN